MLFGWTHRCVWWCHESSLASCLFVVEHWPGEVGLNLARDSGCMSCWVKGVQKVGRLTDDQYGSIILVKRSKFSHIMVVMQTIIIKRFDVIAVEASFSEKLGRNQTNFGLFYKVISCKVMVPWTLRCVWPWSIVNSSNLWVSQFKFILSNIWELFINLSNNLFFISQSIWVNWVAQSFTLICQFVHTLRLLLDNKFLMCLNNYCSLFLLSRWLSLFKMFTVDQIPSCRILLHYVNIGWNIHAHFVCLDLRDF